MNKERSQMRYLGIDPGEKRIGISISDPTGIISRPLQVLSFFSYEKCAKDITSICQKNEIGAIIIGISYDVEGEVTFSGRKAIRLAEALKKEMNLPITFWDEENTTQRAQQSRRLMGVKRSKRSGHLDDVAACILLQDFLDSQIAGGSTP